MAQNKLAELQSELDENETIQLPHTIKERRQTVSTIWKSTDKISNIGNDNNNNSISNSSFWGELHKQIYEHEHENNKKNTLEKKKDNNQIKSKRAFSESHPSPKFERKLSNPVNENNEDSTYSKSFDSLNLLSLKNSCNNSNTNSFSELTTMTKSEKDSFLNGLLTNLDNVEPTLNNFENKLHEDPNECVNEIFEKIASLKKSSRLIYLDETFKHLQTLQDQESINLEQIKVNE